MNCVADQRGGNRRVNFRMACCYSLSVPCQWSKSVSFLWPWFPEIDYCNTQIPALTLPLLCHSQYKIIKVFRVANQFHLFRLGFDCHSNNWPKVPTIKKYSNCTPIGIQIWNLGKGEYYPISAWLFHIAFRNKDRKSRNSQHLLEPSCSFSHDTEVMSVFMPHNPWRCTCDLSKDVAHLCNTANSQKKE